jgi:hypothetical protein
MGKQPMELATDFAGLKQCTATMQSVKKKDL